MKDEPSVANKLAAKFKARADEIRAEIIQYIGCELKVGKITWVLHSNNDSGCLYWHKKGQKRLYTIGVYRHTDLPSLFPEINRKED